MGSSANRSDFLRDLSVPEYFFLKLCCCSRRSLNKVCSYSCTSPGRSYGHLGVHDNRARGPCHAVYLRQRHRSRRGERRRGGRLGLGKGLGDALSLLLVRRRVVARLVSVPATGAHGTARKEEEGKQDGLHGKVDFRFFMLLSCCCCC